MANISDSLKTLYQSYPYYNVLYKTVEISHSAIATLQYYKSASLSETLVRQNQQGQSITFLPSNFEISEPTVESGINSMSSLVFGPEGAIVANEILDTLEQNNQNFLEPLKVVYRLYDNFGLAPLQDDVVLYVNTMSLTPLDGVTLELTTTNYMTYSTGKLYTVLSFPGLATNG